MAPESIMLHQNTTIFTDDMIGSRVGLVPFRADARRYKYCPLGPNSVAKRLEHPDYGVVFEIVTTPEKIPPPTRGATKHPPLVPFKVYSRNFKWVPHPIHPQNTSDANLRPIDDDILLFTLHPAQELSFRVFLTKGIGKDQAKFSPVCTATFKPKPKLKLLRPIIGEDAERLKSCFPPRVVEIEKDDKGSDHAVIKDSRLYAGGRQIFDDPDLKDAVEIGFLENQFIFTVESVGALRSSILLNEALKILRNRCEYHMLDISRHRLTNVVIKTEEHF